MLIIPYARKRTAVAGTRTMPTYVNASHGASDAYGYTAVTLTTSGTLINDLQLYVSRPRTDTGGTNAPSGTGWTYYGEVVYTGSSRIKLWYRILTSDAQAGSDAGASYRGGMFITLRNVDTTTPIADLQVNYTGTNGTSFTLPAATSTYDNSLVCMIVEGPSQSTYSSWTNTDLANITEQTDSPGTYNGQTGPEAFATGEDAVAGAIGAGSSTASGNNNPRIGVTIVINGAP